MQTHIEDNLKKNKNDIIDIKKELDGFLNKRRNFSTTDLEEVEIELQKIKEQTSSSSADQNKVKEIIQSSFFDGELSSSQSEDEEMKDDFIPENVEKNSVKPSLKIPPLTAFSSNFISPQQEMANRDVIMSENLNGNNQNENGSTSLFDTLLQKGKGESNIQSNPQHSSSPPIMNRDPLESTSLIENMLTEYLITLPSSLEEFYKVMGELYV